jgi:pilus assembly protein Flp/PilA
MTKMFKKLAGDRSGATAIEYGLIAALIAIAMAATAGPLGDSIAAKFKTVDDQVKAAQ